MKKILFITLAAILSLLFNSCEEYLEPSSCSEYTEDMVFSNLDFAEKAVNAIYAVLTEDILYSYNMGWYKCDADIEFSITVSSNSIFDVAHLTTSEDNSEIYYAWTKYFLGIEKASLCIKHLPESDMWTDETDSETAKRLYAEAVVLRAYLYFDCIRYWGDVPFSTEPQDEEDLYSYKVDRDSIYEYLIQDIKDVEDYLPWLSDYKNSRRVTKGFAKGLRARMALAYAGYSLRNNTFETRRGRYWEDYYVIANEECKELIESGEHSLNPSYEAVFKNLHEYTLDLTYNEILFELGMMPLNGGRFLACACGMYSTGNTYGACWGNIRTTPVYYYSFGNDDERRQLNCALYYYNDAKQTIINPYSLFYTSKWRRCWLDMGGAYASNQRLGINWPLMRYSDILLMYAETENEINNGPTDAAKNALAEVRKRAFDEENWDADVTEYIDSISSSKDDFFNAIVDERAWEFGGEFLRKDDLIRWNLYGDKIEEMKEEFVKIIDGTSKYSYKIPDYIFYTNDGNDLIILNPDYRMSDASVDGYTKLSWFPLLSETTKQSHLNNLNKASSGYNSEKNNHLIHMDASTISSSNGYLSNDQIPE